MRTARTPRTGRSVEVNIDIFSGAYRISGVITVGNGGIQAALGDPNSDYLELEQVYISRINEPGMILTSYPTCALRKDSIGFILLQDRRDGLLPGGTRTLFSRGKPLEAFLTVASFEIRGQVPYEGKPNPAAMLAQSVSRYQFVYQATATAALYPGVTYQGDLILVDEKQIGFYCLRDTE